MESLLTSTLTVALAEIGDKTQLLALFLATRFSSKRQIVLGILVATLLNHAVSVWFGITLSEWIPADQINHIIAISFIAVGLWLLIPDKDDNDENTKTKRNAFITTFLLFSIAEIGDKTQVASMILGAHYQSVLLVTIGTTIGMMAANVPVVFAGQHIMKKLGSLKVNRIACILFVGIGLFIW
ncbi:TMEM165/GDT1 family protein [Marinomonas balearica]|uniref:GDT1 family protein n=1 Tax=Marinomonas balearica TaxID=491947 RepID=A0A4R6M8R4_9GAMM|nr:TMEM165/GDT1 family protein [Marinomonas balearica]TDO97576.1 putative Ca2+/H+ antiporter (TMEM165/GDT1 family) [Marinomonas balearica]